MERINNFDRYEILQDLFEKLSDLYDLEEKGWQVNPAIEKVREEINQLCQSRLSDLTNKLGEFKKNKNEGKGVPSTNS